MDTTPTTPAQAQRALEKWRKARKLSQRVAAAMVRATGPAWHEWETGGRTPSHTMRVALCALTSIPADAWASDIERDRATVVNAAVRDAIAERSTT